MFIVALDQRGSYALPHLNKRIGMSSVLERIMETWEVTKLTFWFRQKYFSVDYEDKRRIVIPYEHVSSLEFDKPFAKDGYAYICALLITSKAQYAFMFRGKIDEFQESESDFESDELYSNMMDLELYLFENRFKEAEEISLTLDITDMGGICHY